MAEGAIWLDGFEYGRRISPDVAPVDTPAGFAAVLGRLDTLFAPAMIVVPLDCFLPVRSGSAQDYVDALDASMQGRLGQKVASLFQVLPPLLAAKAVPQLPGPADLLHDLAGDDDDDIRDDASFVLTDMVRALASCTASVILVREQDPQVAQLCGSILNIIHDQGKKAALRGRHDAAFDLSFPTDRALGDRGAAAANGAIIVTVDARARPEEVLASFAALRSAYDTGNR